MSAALPLALEAHWKGRTVFAAPMEAPGEYPIVIIGSGLGGLCCGAYLARQGLPVTVIEKQSRPGGYATAFDRGNGKFRFEVSLHGIAAQNNAVARTLKEVGALEKLDLVELSEVYRLKTPEWEFTIPQRDPEAYIRSLSEFFPSEADNVRRFIGDMIRVAEEADALIQKGMPTSVCIPFLYPKMYGCGEKTLAQLLNDYIRDKKLQMILASMWDFHGLPPSQVSGLYYAVATGECLRNGTYYIKQRSQDLSDVLAGVITDAGGRVLLETRAEQILLKNGSVAGVRVAGGEIIPARAVVSNANPLATIRDMLPKDTVSPEYLKDLEGYRPSLSTFIVWLGLNQEIRGRIPSCGVQVISDGGPEAAYHYGRNGAVEKAPFRVSIFDNMYGGYSQPGTSTLKIFCLSGFEPWRRFETAYRLGEKTDYNAEKDRWANVLIRRTEEQVLPGLTSMIEVQEAASPLTNWRFTGNEEGAVYGFEQSLHHAYIERVDNRSPVKGLYMAGAWCTPGGGFWGVLLSGRMTFHKMMEDWEP